MPPTIREIWTAEIERARDRADATVAKQYCDAEIYADVAEKMQAMNKRIAMHCRRQMVALTNKYTQELEAMQAKEQVS